MLGKFRSGCGKCVLAALSCRNPLEIAAMSALRQGGSKRDKLNWTNRAEFFRRFSLIFADFCASWESQHFGGADFRRKPQETADFRRKPQETADFRRNLFVPFGLSLSNSALLCSQ